MLKKRSFELTGNFKFKVDFFKVSMKTEEVWKQFRIELLHQNL